MSYEFYVGQKVVCVDAEDHPVPDFSPQSVPLVKGDVYTIRQLDIGVFSTLAGEMEGLAVWVVGVNRSDANGDPSDDPFGAERFRPLTSKSADLFKAIVKGVEDGSPIISDEATERLREMELYF